MICHFKSGIYSRFTCPDKSATQNIQWASCNNSNSYTPHQLPPCCQGTKISVAKIKIITLYIYNIFFQNTLFPNISLIFKVKITTKSGAEVLSSNQIIKLVWPQNCTMSWQHCQPLSEGIYEGEEGICP
jgi:hypothetical protein